MRQDLTLMDRLYTPNPILPPDLIREIKNLRRGFIEDYTDYARLLTDAPEIFHCACAFGILSGVIGRRAWEPMFKTAPNLWILLLGPTSIYRKSTCLRIARGMLLTNHKDILIPSDFSPQALLSEFSARDGQSCMLFRDEASGFFSSINRLRFMTGTKELLINLFDGDPLRRKLQTQEFVVERPYFVWLGGAVTDKLVDSITEEDILSGLMVRFVLVNPEERGPTKPLSYEVTRADRYRRLLGLRLLNMERFFDEWPPFRSKEIEEGLDHEERFNFVLDHHGLAMFNKYAARLEREGSSDSTLEKIHARIIPLTLKLATILAVDHHAKVKRILNTAIIPYPVLLKAIYWAETFREHLARTLVTVGRTTGERRYGQIIDFIKENEGITRGKLMRRFQLKAAEMDEMVKTLQQRDILEIRIRKSKTKPAETLWIIE